MYAFKIKEGEKYTDVFATQNIPHKQFEPSLITIIFKSNRYMNDLEVAQETKRIDYALTEWGLLPEEYEAELIVDVTPSVVNSVSVLIN